MKLTEEYIKNFTDNVIELKCNRLVRLVDENGKAISTFIEPRATIEAEKDIVNKLFVLLKSDSEGFRAYGYIDKEDYDAFEVLNPQCAINRERLNEFLDNFTDDEIIDALNKLHIGCIQCRKCPIEHCDNNGLDCGEGIIAWLKGEI